MTKWLQKCKEQIGFGKMAKFQLLTSKYVKIGKQQKIGLLSSTILTYIIFLRKTFILYSVSFLKYLTLRLETMPSNQF